MYGAIDRSINDTEAISGPMFLFKLSECIHSTYNPPFLIFGPFHRKSTSWVPDLCHYGFACTAYIVCTHVAILMWSTHRFHPVHWDQTMIIVCQSLGSRPILVLELFTLVHRLFGTTSSCLFVQSVQLLPLRNIWRHISLIWPFPHRYRHSPWPVDVTELFPRLCCWTLIWLSRHWAWLRRGYWHYRSLIDWLIWWCKDLCFMCFFFKFLFWNISATNNMLYMTQSKRHYCIPGTMSCLQREELLRLTQQTHLIMLQFANRLRLCYESQADSQRVWSPITINVGKYCGASILTVRTKQICPFVQKKKTAMRCICQVEKASGTTNLDL